MRREDVAICAEMVADTPLWQRYGYGERLCARDLRAGLARGDRLNVALLGGTLAGLAWILPRGGFGRIPYLKLLAVSAKARGQGVGGALLGASHSSGDLVLLVSDFNRRARRFYAALGYERVGALPGLVLPGVTEVLLFKRMPAGAGVTGSSRRRRTVGRAGARPGADQSRARSTR